MPQSPFRKYHPPIPSAVRWTEGFLPQRVAINRKHTLESVWRRFTSADSAVTFKNFEIAAGLEYRNMAAVQRGPVVYCLEACDLPEGVDVDEVYLPRNAQFDSRFESDTLGGIVTLHTQATHIPEEKWESRLYQVVKPVSPKAVDIALIPYFAWANRDIGKMSVWLPVV